MASVICTYDLQATQMPYHYICSDITCISYMIVDGIRESPSATYTFSTLGIHTVEFVLIGTTITESTFYDTDYLINVVISDEVKTIGKNAFKYCTDLVTITLGSGLTTIGDYAFDYCIALLTVDLPQSLKTIGNYAFVSCYNLNTISTIPSGVTLSEYPPFAGCHSLEAIHVDVNNPYYDDGNGSNCIIEKGTGVLIQGCKNTIIPKGVTEIGHFAFDGNAPTSLTLPYTVSKIGTGAFEASNLERIFINRDLRTIGSSAFDNANLKEIVIMTFDAPSVDRMCFNDACTGGTLYCPIASDYSSWMSNNEYYLGYYDWNVVHTAIFVDMPLTVREETLTPFSITYRLGKTINFNTPDNIIITEGETINNYDNTLTTTYQIYINEEYSLPTADIIITDGDDDTITKTITVVENDNPMAAPTISINRYADLAFPQSGATKYITITYTNTSTSYISTPYSSEPDVTISQESVSVTDNGVEIYYSIHVPATQYERNIPLIFSCSSPEGSSATETFTGLQDGDARPEGLTLSSTAGSFAAEGESKDITVTYPSGKTLNVSVASSTGVRPIAWCTATSDGTTGGSTVYTITMTANEFTESRTALVNFSYQADGGEYITAQYVAVQSAAGGAGEESSLSLYRTVMNFSADGVFDFGAAVCKADYRWTEEVDIDEPEVDVSWIVVSEGEHQTGAGYIIVPWGIAVARNTSTSSRTGTVTFSSVGNDDIMHTAVLTVTQEGSGGGEEQEPEGVNLIWKDLPVELPDDDMVYELLDENYDVFFKGRSAKRPSDEANRFYLNRIMQDYIYMDEIPELVATTGTVRHHENAMKTVRIDYDGIIGATPAYNFKYDWSYTYDSPFILSESIIPYFVQGQRLLITCCNINDNNPQTDTYSFISGGQVQSGSISADAHDYKTMSVAVPSNTDVILLGGQRYEVLRSCQYRYVLYYLSPKGGWCWFPVMGRVNKRDNVTQYSYTKNYDNQTAEFGKSRYLAEIGTKYELNTGWLREHESLRMWEVLETNMAYLHDLYEDKVIPVIMTDETVEHKNKARDRKLISYSFNVEASQPKVRF